MLKKHRHQIDEEIRMEKQTISVPLARNLLKPDDLKLNETGDLTIDKQLINKLVRENINKIPDKSEAAVSVSVTVSF